MDYYLFINFDKEEINYTIANSPEMALNQGFEFLKQSIAEDESLSTLEEVQDLSLIDLEAKLTYLNNYNCIVIKYDNLIDALDRSKITTVNQELAKEVLL